MSPAPNLTSKSSLYAFTWIELLGLIVILGLLLGILIPSIAKSRMRASRISCIAHLKYIGLAYRIYSTDNADRLPWERFDELNGPLDPDTNNLIWNFTIISNELGAQFLTCPTDKTRPNASNWTNLTSTNISYFLNLRATQSAPQRPLAGDSNLRLGGKTIPPGLHSITSNTPIQFDNTRHVRLGNMVLSDGSVFQISSDPATPKYPIETNALLFIP